MSIGDWNAHGCYKRARALRRIFGKYRIEGNVDKCKEAAEKSGFHVFGVGVRIIKLQACRYEILQRSIKKVHLFTPVK